MQWSCFFQSPRYLEITRKYYLVSPDLRPLICSYIGVKENMTVLDVGCGSGFFTRLVAENMTAGRVVGVDIDAVHIDAAKKIIGADGLTERIEFITADALALPFADDSFDLVTSQTFFNVVKGSEKALAEMIRVTKNGGVVASLDNMTLGNQTWHTGYYQELAWLTRFRVLEKKVLQMFMMIYPLGKIAAGIPTSEIPHFFAARGLKNVRIYGLGRVFSLSNAAMDAAEKAEYIHCLYEDSWEKVHNYRQLPQITQYITNAELDEYLALLTQYRDYQLALIGENLIWDWNGGGNLLTVADVVK